MSNILRRPMFRGGRVSSYGNGIASGLADGGRVGYQGGGAINNWFSRIAGQAPKGGVGPATTGSSLLQDALSKVKNVPYLGRVASPIINLGSKASPYSPYVLAGGAGYGLGTLADFLYEGMSTPEKYIETKRIGEEEPFAYAETDLIVNEDGTSPGSTTTRGEQIDKYLGEINVGEKPGFFPRGGREKFMRDRGYDLKTGKKISDMPFEVSGGVAEVQPGETALDAILREAGRVTKSDFSSKKDTEEKISLTAEEMIAANKELFRKELGYDQARRSDIGDLLGRVSVAALKKPGRGEKRDFGDIAGDVVAMELAAGPGRKEKIDQSAAVLAINDYIAGKRSKEQLDSILAKTKFGVDYQAEVAGKATAVSGGESKKAWINDLKNVASRTRDKQITDTDVIKTTLFERYETPVNIKSFNKKTLESIVNENAKDLSVGFNIVIAKDGKFIIEKKPNGQSRIRTDLPIT
jgi:hypothetical protein